MAKESQPGRTTGALPRPVVPRENPSNHVFVDLDVERQGHLLSDSRTAPVGIPLLHFDDRTDKFCARPLRAGLPTAILGEQQAVLSLAQGLVKTKQCRRPHYNCGTEQTGWKHQEPSKPARMRSQADSLGDRRRERFKIRSWCLRRSDSATRERTPPAPSRRTRMARKWMKRTTR